MKHRLTSYSSPAFLLGGFFLITIPALAQSAAASMDYGAYVHTVEGRLDQQHRSPLTFLNLPGADPQAAALKLRAGEILSECLTNNAPNAPGALIHHWRATAFVPGATAEHFDHLMRTISEFPRYYSPQVVRASSVMISSDHMQATMRIRQTHILTVVLDADYNIRFGALDPAHRFITSRSSRVQEIEQPGAPGEHPLPAGNEHGWLWRMNTYWTCLERDGGIYLQVESITLTRAIPAGLDWAIRPYIETVPRQSLEFTLRATAAALTVSPQTQKGS